MDIDTALTNINATSTPSRKAGIQTLLELIKSYYHDSKDENDENSSTNGIEDLFKNSGKLDDLFTALSWLLRDSTEPQIQRDAVEILIAIITKNLIRDKLDFYVHRVFKYLLVCFNAPNMSVRKSANQCFHEYLNKTADFTETIGNYIDLTLNRDDLSFNQRRDYNQTLQIVLTRNFADKKFDVIIQGILKQIETCETDDKTFSLVIGVLKHIRKVFGDAKVLESVHNLNDEYQSLYFDHCQNILENKTPTVAPTPSNFSENGYDFPNSSSMKSLQSKSFSLSSISVTSKLHCGFIADTTYESLQGDRKLESIEELSGMFNKVKMDNKVNVVLPHLKELLGIIRKLMGDQYNVIIKTLSFLIDLIQNCPDNSLTEHISELVELLRISLINNMNTDAIMQKLIASYSMVLFKKLDSMVLMRRLCDNQFINDQKQSIRWMSINIIISALLEFPSNKFDLNFITMKVVHRLLDKRPKVKQAALECMAVLGSYLGHSPMSQMMKLIEQTISDPEQLELIKRQIHHRLTMHKLPHRNDNGSIVYAMDYDKFMKHMTNSSRASSVQGGGDYNSSSDNSPISSANIMEKRRPSAGTVRGRAKLPWDQNESPSSSSKPFSKAPGSNSNSNNSKSYEPSGAPNMQYSQMPLSMVHPSEFNGARNIKKFSELTSGNELEIASLSSSPSSAASSSSLSSNKVYGGLGSSRNSKFDSNNNMTSFQTSGYNSGSTTARQTQNTPKSESPKDDCATATNSTTTTPRNANNNKNRTDDSDVSPIPTKPALARSAGNKRREIDNSRSNQVTNEAIAVVPTESQIKVEHIRNSASKKKAQKIFSSNQSSASSPDSVSPRSFNSQISLDSVKGTSVLKHPPNNNEQSIPTGIIGRSVNSENMDAHEKKKAIKGMLDTTNNGLSTNRASPATFNNNTTSTDTSKKLPEQILRSSLSESALKTTSARQSIPSTNNQSKDTTKNNNESTGSENKNLNNGIRGVGISHDNTDSDEEIPHNVKMSNTLRESVSLKRLKQVSGESQSSLINDKYSQDYNTSHSAPGTAKNRVKPPIGVNTVPGTNSGYHAGNSAASVPNSATNERTENNVPPSRKPLRPVYGVNKSKSNITNLNSSEGSPTAAWTSEPNVTTSTSQPAALPNPDKSIPQSLNLIRHEDWEDKMEALIIFQSLAIYHSDTLLAKPQELHAICLAITREIMNLRSQVARMGIQTAGYYFNHLKKAIDSELDQIVKALFSRASDQSVGFIRQDVEATLILLIDNVSPNRLICAMVHNYIDNKNVALRRMAASNLMHICEKFSHTKFISIIKDMNDKVIFTIVKFTTDSNNETRYFGRRIIYELMKNGEFDKICHKALSESDLRQLQTVIENIKSKGIGDPPKLTQSAGLGRTHSMSRGGSANNPGGSQAPGAHTPQAPPPNLSRRSSRSMTRLPTSSINNDSSFPNDSSAQYNNSPTNWIASLCDQLKSPDFRQRLQALDSLLQHTELPSSQQQFLLVLPKTLNRLIIELIPTLKDNNSRVAIASLHLTQKFLPCVRSNFPNEHLSRLVNCVAHGFSSKSPDIRQQSLTLMQVIFETIDPVPLIQPCIESINNANKATKPSLVDNFSSLLIIQQQQASNRLSNALVRHIVPFISHLIETSKPLSNHLRESLQHLIQAAYEIVGPDLLEQAGQRGGPKLKQCFAEFVK